VTCRDVTQQVEFGLNCKRERDGDSPKRCQIICRPNCLHAESVFLRRVYRTPIMQMMMRGLAWQWRDACVWVATAATEWCADGRMSAAVPRRQICSRHRSAVAATVVRLLRWYVCAVYDYEKPSVAFFPVRHKLAENINTEIGKQIDRCIMSPVRDWDLSNQVRTGSSNRPWLSRQTGGPAQISKYRTLPHYALAKGPWTPATFHSLLSSPLWLAPFSTPAMFFPC